MRSESSGVQVIGDAVRTLRVAIGWTQRELAARARVSQALVSRVERGRVADLTFATAELLLRTLGAKLVMSVSQPYLAGRERQRDPAHARLATHVVGRLHRADWHVRTEVEVGGDRSRGWIDILAFHPGTSTTLVVEIKTEIHDLGEIERRLGWYEREAAIVARRSGWRPVRAIGWLMVLATTANDARVLANRASIDLAFPLRARQLQRVVDGELLQGAPGRGIAMVDPRSRRAAWVRPLRSDGRRSPAPYADYADFMRRAGRPPQRGP